MKHRKSSKLTLSKETLRVLDTATLPRVAGGGFQTGSLKCQTGMAGVCISNRECLTRPV